MPMSRLSECKSGASLSVMAPLQERADTSGARLTGVDHLGVVEIVQADEDLVERGRDEDLLEDVPALQPLKRSQAHAQRHHDEHLVVAVRAWQYERLMQLAEMLLARMVGCERDAGQVVVDDTLLVVSQGVDVHFERPVFPVSGRVSTRIRQHPGGLDKTTRTVGLGPARRWMWRRSRAS